jgi:flagellar biosynthesis protein FlhF
MELEQFIAASAAEAAQQIRAKLGADAVVVNIRQIPSRWFQKPRIEVLARAAEHAEPATGHLLDTTDEVTPPISQPPPPAQAVVSVTEENPPPSVRPGERPRKRREPAALLESLGVLPVYAERVLDQVLASQPRWLLDDLKHVRGALAATWIRHQPSSARLHVFVGAPGLGKTTTLCKWLTLSTLLKGMSARVWRLDGATANTAEALSVHGEVLGVPVERTWAGDGIKEDIGFVDVPGTVGADMDGVCAIIERLGQTTAMQVHLVLNAAYDTTVSLAQARAWATVPVHDLIVTHLDEEPRWCKLWNLMLGTGLPIRFLSTGQNIPSDFMEGNAERVLSHVFPRI